MPEDHEQRGQRAGDHARDGPGDLAEAPAGPADGNQERKDIGDGNNGDPAEVNAEREMYKYFSRSGTGMGYTETGVNFPKCEQEKEHEEEESHICS